MDDKASSFFGLSPLSIAIIGIICAATLLSLYHCLVGQWCTPRNTPVSHRQWASQNQPTDIEDFTVTPSITELLPSYKYSKDVSLVCKTEGGSCSVCLCEFKEGEPVRVLPECLHSFHVPCIDMWLYSHTNCPICRTDTMPTREPVGRRSGSGQTRLPPVSGQRSVGSVTR